MLLGMTRPRTILERRASVPKPSIVVAGGGYAGMAALAAFQRRNSADVTLVDPSPVHQLIPELPTALREGGSVGQHTMPFAELLKDTGVSWRQDAVRRVLAAEKRVILHSGGELVFDWLLMCVGSTTRWPSVPGLRNHAYPFRTAVDAQALRDRLAHNDGLMVVVLGGGLTGVEVAGELAARHRVRVLEAAPRVLPEVGPGLSRYADRVLRQKGVAILAPAQVKAVEASRLLMDGGDAISYDVLVWTGGIAPPDVDWAGVDMDDHGYPVPDEWGQVAPSVFVAGDAYIVRRRGEIVPQTAQLAEEAGTFVAHTVLARIRDGRPGPPFDPHFKGLLVALDSHRGVGWVMRRGLAVKGYSARALKGLVFSQYRSRLGASFREASTDD